MNGKKWFGLAAVTTAIGAAAAFVVAKSKMAKDGTSDAASKTMEATKSAVVETTQAVKDTAGKTVESAKSTVRNITKKSEADAEDAAEVDAAKAASN